MFSKDDVSVKRTAGIHFITLVYTRYRVQQLYCTHYTLTTRLLSCRGAVCVLRLSKTTFFFLYVNLDITYCTVMLLMSSRWALWGWGGWQPSLQFRRRRHEDGHRRGRSRRPKLAFNQTQYSLCSFVHKPIISSAWDTVKCFTPCCARLSLQLWPQSNMPSMVRSPLLWASSRNS